MPKIRYIRKRFSTGCQRTIVQAIKIIEEYQAQGYDLTLRQLYYQFVSQDLIANELKEYKRLGDIINNARLAGLIDWNAIVDRTRFLRRNSHWDSPQELVEACADQYLIDKWATQSDRVEVWIEKDALVGVIEGVCTALDVPYFSCRGYTSQSAMWRAAQRLKGYEHEGQEVTILHLGDHDPSGMDMSDDIQRRLSMFMGLRAGGVNRIALNMDQIKKYTPPPNPAKLTDSRAQAYIREYGHDSWELDALEPKVLSDLITDNVLKLRDQKLWQKAVKVEAEHKEILFEAAENL